MSTMRHQPFAILRLHTRARRRAAVLALWAAFCAHVSINTFGGDGHVAGLWSVLTLLAGMACLFSLAEASVLRGGAGPVDAARLVRRDQVYALSFHATGWLLVAVAVYTQVASRVDWLWLPGTARQAVSALACVSVAIGLLPATLLGWSEPDERPVPPVFPPMPPAPHARPRPQPQTFEDSPRWTH